MLLNLIVIRSKHPADLSKFYTLLGLTFEFHQHASGPMHHSAKLGDLTFEIYPLQKGQTEPDNSLRLGFSVKDLDQMIKMLTEHEIVILRKPFLSEWGYSAIIQDFDGRKIELTTTNN